MMRHKIIEDSAKGCLPIATGFLLAILVCILITMCGCRPQKEFIEVEKWQHDTTTVVDTVRVVETITVHDSIFKTEYITQFVKDSTHKDEAWQYITYDPQGNITSLLNYNSSTYHGTEANTAQQSASTTTSDTSYQKEENSSHSESSGHSDASHVTKETKPQLNGWQRFVMGMGYAFIVVIALGVTFGAMRLYGKIKGL